MVVCVSYKLAPPVVKLFQSVLQDIGKILLFLLYKLYKIFHLHHTSIFFPESDTELEGLMPEASDIDIKLLNIEPEKNPFTDERQSLGKKKLFNTKRKVEAASGLHMKLSLYRQHTNKIN